MVLRIQWAHARRLVTVAATAALGVAFNLTPAAASTTGHLSAFTGGCTGNQIHANF